MGFEMCQPHGSHAYDRIASITRTGAAQRTQSSDMVDLQMRLERQNMVIQALLMLLVEKKVIGADEFEQWIEYVDGLDGRVDGRLAPDRSPQRCPRCQRNNSSTAVQCQYCGSEFQTRAMDRRHQRG